MNNAKEILDFYILCGISETTCEEPFAFYVEKKTNTKRDVQVGVNAIDEAKKIALQSNSLDVLFEKIINFSACPLKQTSNHTIVGQGNANAKNMIIIDAPSDDDERNGKVFSGKYGEFISNFLKAIKIDKEDCFFATLLPWRPPGNRAPTELEVETCKPFLEKQINLINPQKIFAFGLETSQILANDKKTINQLREEKIIYQSAKGENIEVVASFAISNLLFNPSQKAKLWDFLIKCD